MQAGGLADTAKYKHGYITLQWEKKNEFERYTSISVAQGVPLNRVKGILQLDSRWEECASVSLLLVDIYVQEQNPSHTHDFDVYNTSRLA
jgi:hypothetical protein